MLLWMGWERGGGGIRPRSIKGCYLQQILQKGARRHLEPCYIFQCGTLERWQVGKRVRGERGEDLANFQANSIPGDEGRSVRRGGRG